MDAAFHNSTHLGTAAIFCRDDTAAATAAAAPAAAAAATATCSRSPCVSLCFEPDHYYDTGSGRVSPDPTAEEDPMAVPFAAVDGGGNLTIAVVSTLVDFP